jgi:hypothetical protein
MRSAAADSATARFKLRRMMPMDSLNASPWSEAVLDRAAGRERANEGCAS